jgi:hypothetical protein
MMSKFKNSSAHYFVMGMMACLVGVLCVTVSVLEENLMSRVIMASIWIIVAVWWLFQAAKTRKSDSRSIEDKSHDGSRPRDDT